MEVSNRTIWTYWQQGYDQAPALVQAVLDSWRRLNPGWQVVALDRWSLADWLDLRSLIDPERSDLDVQKLSNIVRFALLRRYGGVWADATAYCCRPLDDWLPRVYGAGFFAFRNPGVDRLLSTWFLAAEKDHPILVAMHDTYLQIWRTTFFANQNNRFGKWAVARLSPFLNKTARRATWWTAPIVRRTLRAYPYFFLHYTLNKVLLSNAELLRLWRAAESLEALDAHALQSFSTQEGGRHRALWMLREKSWTVQKLDWRLDLATPYWRAVLGDLAALSAT